MAQLFGLSKKICYFFSRQTQENVMQLIFLLLVVGVPWVLGYVTMSHTNPGEYAQKWDTLIIMFILSFAIISYLFRERMYGREAIHSVFSFECAPVLGVSAGLAAISGAFINSPEVSVILFLLSYVSAGVIIHRGPSYGWDTHRKRP